MRLRRYCPYFFFEPRRHSYAGVYIVSTELSFKYFRKYNRSFYLSLYIQLNTIDMLHYIWS